MWFDLVRYSEAVVRPAVAEGVTTLVLRYKLLPPVVTHVAAVAHHRLLDALRLDTTTAHVLLELRERVPRSLNAQAQLTWNDIAAASEFVLERSVTPLDDGTDAPRRASVPGDDG